MSFQQDAARSLGRGDQAPMGPNPAYPQSSGPQYPPSNFQYPASDYPSLDTDMNMNDPFSHTQSITSQLQEAAGGAPQRNGDVNAISVDTNGSVTAGMGPPQTPHQGGFSPTGQRASIDETPDSATTVEDANKRRRSKVSRACDECRRKKIKCDSADTTDGTIKTCTNCSKASMTCEFSRVPMKRGPSKGYIKELSERVERMESRQSSLGQPGYRPSFDGSSVTDPLYSPDDPMSAKRQFSFSSDTRNPFAPTDYQRDQMPSAGTAWYDQSPAAFGVRDRGSLALAPDQRLPSARPTPAWADADDLEPPPAKRRKAEAVNVILEAAQISKYEDAIHSNFPLIPDVNAASRSILASTERTESLKIFATVLALLPSTHATQQNGEHVNRADAELFSSADELYDALGRLVSANPTLRTNKENTVLMWSCALLALQREFDIRSNRSDLGPATRSFLLKAAMDLAETLIQDGDPTIQNAAKQAKTLCNVMSRLDWFATGAQRNWSKTGVKDFRSIPDYHRSDYSAFPEHPNMAFLVRATKAFKPLQTVVQSPIALEDEFALLTKDDLLEASFYECLEAPGAPAGLDGTSLLVRQVFGFMKLISSPYIARPAPPMVVLEHALHLARTLAEPTDSHDSPFRYNPLDYHLYTITMTTLLAFLDKVPDASASKLAEEALNALKPAIEQKLTIYRHAAKVKDGGRQYAGFYGEGVQNTTWMDALLKLMEQKSKEKWAISRVGAQPLGGQAGYEFLEDFITLIRTGYGRILAAYGGREVAPVGE